MVSVTKSVKDNPSGENLNTLDKPPDGAVGSDESVAENASIVTATSADNAPAGIEMLASTAAPVPVLTVPPAATVTVSVALSVDVAINSNIESDSVKDANVGFDESPVFKVN